jgi:hypothetical protein
MHIARMFNSSSSSIQWAFASPGIQRYALRPLFQSGSRANIQDPGFHCAPPWAEVYYAFGVLPRCDLLKMP